MPADRAGGGGKGNPCTTRPLATYWSIESWMSRSVRHPGVRRQDQSTLDACRRNTSHCPCSGRHLITLNKSSYNSEPLLLFLRVAPATTHWIKKRAAASLPPRRQQLTLRYCQSPSWRKKGRGQRTRIGAIGVFDPTAFSDAGNFGMSHARVLANLAKKVLAVDWL
jgi:hypothetical protein